MLTVGGLLIGGGSILAMLVSANPILAAIVAGVAALTIGLGALEKAIDEANKSLDEFEKEIADTEAQIQANKDRLNEINSISWQDRTAEIRAEKRELEAENEELERQLELQKEKEKESAKKVVEGGETVQRKKFGMFYEGGTKAINSFDTWREASRAAYGTDLIVKRFYEDVVLTGNDLYNYLIDKSNKYIKILIDENSLTDDQADALDDLLAKMYHQVQALEIYRDSGEELTSEQEALINSYYELTKAQTDAVKVQTDAVNATNLHSKSLQELADAAGVTIAEMVKLIAEEQVFNNTTLSVSEKIEALKILAKQAGITGEAFYEMFKGLRGEEVDWDKVLAGIGGSSGGTINFDTGKSTGKSAAEKQQEAYQAMFKIIEKNIEREISILEREKDKIDDFYQSQIDALKEENDEIEKQIQLEELQERLAEARSQKKLVYVDGKFQYMDDLDAISEAQKALEDEQRVQALEEETDRLEKLKDQEIANIQAQIDAWEQYKDEWSSVVDNYAEEQDALLVLQQLGIDLEGENWKLRLDNLQDYVNEYKRISAQVSAEGSSNTGKSETSKSDTGIRVSATDVANAGAFGLYAIQSSGKYAEGTTNAKGGISLVGEKGAELRVLNRGDGILPSSITDTLWRFGNNPASFINNLAGVSSGNSNCYSFSIGNITLPSVTDTDSFITGLKQMAKQRVMSRG